MGKAARKKHVPAPPPKRRRPSWLLPVLYALGAVVVLGAAFVLNSGGKSTGSGAAATKGSSAYPYAVGAPGPGKPALTLSLPSTAGGSFDLASYKGKQQVLLYFQEGLTCQPCWDQLQSIQKDESKFHALGIGPIVSITTDPLNLIKQKVSDDRIRIPVLSDDGANVSTAWSTNKYQMQMMGNRDGHSFILIGKDGRIRWRADYGGAPKYTMFVPDDELLKELKQVTAAK